MARFDTRFDLSHPPFDVLTPAEVSALAARGDLIFFSEGEIILQPGEAVDAFYLVIKGIVRETADDETIGVYRESDTFDSRALVAKKTPHHFIAHEETLLLALPREAVMALTEANPAFGAHFFARVSEKLGGMARHKGRSELQGLMTAMLAELDVQPPVFVEGSATLSEVARMMKERQTKSVLVRDNGRTGIFTASDFRDVIAEAVARETSVRERAKFVLFSCDKGDYLFNALLLMTQRNIQRVVVTEVGQPVGVLEQIDLLSFFSSHSHLITQQIAVAVSMADLKKAAAAIETMIESLAANGMKAPQLARLVQALNVQWMGKLWRLVASPAVFAGTSLLVLGSEGRGEQILRTDQDNALIVAPELMAGSAAGEVARAAEAFTVALVEFGYPLCEGGIMVSNAAWRHTLSEWRGILHRWVHQPSAEGWLNLAVFLDATVISGDRQWLMSCKSVLQQWAIDDIGWLGRMARPVVQFDDGGFFQQWLNREIGNMGENAGGARLDIKKNGIFPVVHGARVLALEAGLEASNTFERLQALAAGRRLERELADDVSEALAFMMRIRLDAGLMQRRLGRPAGNIVDTGRLSTLERDLLREALAVVKRFKVMLNQHFHLDRF